MRLRWKKGTGKPPQGAIIISIIAPVLWQVLQYYVEPLFVDEEEGRWLDIPVVLDESEQ